MRRRSWCVVIAGVVSAAAAIAACTGDDPAVTPVTDGGVGPGNDGASDGGDKRDGAGSSDAATDAGTDAAFPGCGTPDTTPCNCGGGKSCCIGNGAPVCFPIGQEDASAGCSSTETITCAATTCGAGRVCCYNGTLRAGTTCPLAMTSFDTQCENVDPDAAAGHPCTNAPDGFVHEQVCATDMECARFDAGKCVPALMDTVNRVMKICVR